jgi:phage tail-like protein
MPAIKPPHNPDPYGGYNFYVEWDGIIHAGFRECDGLDSKQAATEYREGTDPLTKRKLPGLISYSQITLKRGITDNQELWAWRESVMKGNVVRRNISIVLMNDAGAEKLRWNLTNCWPSSWSGPHFNATSDDVAIEQLELAHEGVARAS